MAVCGIIWAAGQTDQFGLDGFELLVRDATKTIRFYRDVFGFEIDGFITKCYGGQSFLIFKRYGEGITSILFR